MFVFFGIRQSRGVEHGMTKKITLITGAAKGIGFETARLLAGEGHHVIICARKLDAATRAVRRLATDGMSVEALPLDVTDQASIDAAVASVEASHGRLDVLINNAAVLLDHYQGAAQTTTETLMSTFATNVAGAHAMISAFAPLLRKSDEARVINVSSGAGQLSGMTGSVWAPAYQISKTALNALMLLWATEFEKDGIPVNCVCPGWCQTEMGGQQAPRTAKQGAASVARLVLDFPRSVTGGFFRDGERLEWRARSGLR